MYLELNDPLQTQASVFDQYHPFAFECVIHFACEIFGSNQLLGDYSIYCQDLHLKA